VIVGAACHLVTVTRADRLARSTFKTSDSNKNGIGK
jgi:hypothetical protein